MASNHSQPTGGSSSIGSGWILEEGEIPALDLILVEPQALDDQLQAIDNQPQAIDVQQQALDGQPQAGSTEQPQALHAQPQAPSLAVHLAGPFPKARAHARDQSKRARAHVDQALEQCINKFKWPLWRTDGKGGDNPDRQWFNLGKGNLRMGARIDFRRGLAKNDFPSQDWSDILLDMPRYSAELKRHQDPTSVNGRGNALERAVGCAYACFTNFKELGPGSYL